MLSNLVSYFEKGGITMWPLLVFAVLTAVFIIERWLALRRSQVNVGELLAKLRRALLTNHDLRDAITVCEATRGPVAAVLKAALLAYGRPTLELERKIENAAVSESAQLERGLGVLSAAANVAPMVGFLGTVTGMIKVFSALAQDGLSNRGAVSAGISEALISTATGLAIAIVAQLAYHYFTSRIDAFLREIDTASSLLLETFAGMDSAPTGQGGGART